MDVLIGAAAILLLALPAGVLVGAWAGRPDVAAAGFNPYKPDDGWPRGVQEEDPSFVRLFRVGRDEGVPDPTPLRSEPPARDGADGVELDPTDRPRLDRVVGDVRRRARSARDGG